KIAQWCATGMGLNEGDYLTERVILGKRKAFQSNGYFGRLRLDITAKDEGEADVVFAAERDVTLDKIVLNCYYTDDYFRKTVKKSR
ncbi:MAG: hypothetical protein JW994_02510, partial [Candidatus Omnitrophica bacterium]|nr:hypothetical protein [Candidatus Omnitrophota bacterium]